jgi:orotate phosphoribosyltransferase
MEFQYDRALLQSILREHALQFGQFTLASGKQASYYLDCRKVTLHPQGANQIAAGMLDILVSGRFGEVPDAVGGLAIGADPITASIVVHAGLRKLPTRGFMVRKEAKQHGTGKLVEGPVVPGMRAVIVEDVITSGGSALKAASSAREFGLDVVGVLGVIDRLEGGRAAFEAEGIPLETLLTIDDFMGSTER